MSHRLNAQRLARVALVTGLLLLRAQALSAQSSVADSLAPSLANPDVHVRTAAVIQLNALPTSDLSPSIRHTLINLLEAEATGRGPKNPYTTADSDETYSEYIIGLTDAVLRLRDPAALRGLVLLGAQTSGDVERFVASFGRRSLPYLDDAWRTRENARPSVIMMRALTTTVTGPNALTTAQRQRVLASLIDSVATYPTDVARAATAASLVELAPVLADVAAREESDVARNLASRAVSELEPLRAQVSVSTLLEKTSNALAGFCRVGGVEVEHSAHVSRGDTEAHDSRGDTDDPSTRAAACAVIWRGLRLAQADVAAGRIAAAKAKLDLVARAAAFAGTRGIFSSAEVALIQGNARYIITRL
jgi:BMFP domain-containing protein YqiC